MKEITLSINGQPCMTDKPLVKKMVNIASANVATIGTNYAPGSEVLCTVDKKLCVLGYNSSDELEWVVL